MSHLFYLLFSYDLFQTNSLFTKLEVDIKSAQRNQTKCEDKIKAYEDEIENLKSKLNALEERMGEIEKAAKVCMDEFQDLQKQVCVAY